MESSSDTNFLSTQNTGTFESDYQCLKSVGHGGFGEVFKVRSKHDDHTYAVKIVRFDQLKYTNQLQLIKRELVSNAKLAHDNVVRYYHSWVEVSKDQNVDDVSSDGSITASGEGSTPDCEDAVAEKIAGTSDVSNHQRFRGKHTMHITEPFDYVLPPSKKENTETECMFLETSKSVTSATVAAAAKDDDNNNDDDDKDNDDDESEEDYDSNDSDYGDDDSLMVNNTEFDVSAKTKPQILYAIPNLEFLLADETMGKQTKDNEESSHETSGIYRNLAAGIGAVKNKPITADTETDVEDTDTCTDNSGDQEQEATADSPRYFELYIKMEFCDFILRDFIDDGKFVNNQTESWNFFRQIVRGLDYIHSQHIIHRDLNPKNVFVTHDNIVKIGDFGLSRIKVEEGSELAVHDDMTPRNDCRRSDASTSQLTGGIGTRWYSAPEVLYTTRKRYGPECDLFSLGLIFFEMCCCPIKTEQEKAEVFQPLRNDRTFPASFDDPELKSQRKIISGLLCLNPKERTTLKSLLNPAYGYLPPEPKEETHFKLMLQKILHKPKSELHSYMLEEMFSRKRTLGSASRDDIRTQLCDFSKATEVFKTAAEKQHAKRIALPLFLEVSEELCKDNNRFRERTSFLDFKGNPVMLPERSIIAFSQDLNHLKFRQNDRYYSTEIVYKENGWDQEIRGAPHLSFFSLTPKDHLLEIGRAAFILQETLLGAGRKVDEFVLYTSHKNIELGLLKLYGLEEIHEHLKIACGMWREPSFRSTFLTILLEKSSVTKNVPSFFLIPETLDKQSAKIKKILMKEKGKGKNKKHVKAILSTFGFLKNVRNVFLKFGITFSIKVDLFIENPASNLLESGIKLSLRSKNSGVPTAEGGHYEIKHKNPIQKGKGFLFLEIDSQKLRSGSTPSLQTEPDAIIVFNRSDQLELETTAYLIGVLSRDGLVVGEVDKRDTYLSPVCKYLITIKAEGRVVLQYQQDLKEQQVEMKSKTVVKHIRTRRNIEYSMHLCACPENPN